MKESKLFKRLVTTLVVIVLGGPAVVLADTPSYIEGAKATGVPVILYLNGGDHLLEIMAETGADIQGHD